MSILIALALFVSLQQGYKPVECFDSQFAGDLADAKEGRWMAYVTEAGGTKLTNSVKVVGKVDDDWLIEQQMDFPVMNYSFLFRVGPDKKIKKAWSAATGDTQWTPIVVKESPKPSGVAGPKPDIKQSEESKEIKVGKLECTRLDVTVSVQGRDYKSISWYSKRVWRLSMPTEHGGLVAMEASGSKTTLDAMGGDARPTLPLPK